MFVFTPRDIFMGVLLLVAFILIIYADFSYWLKQQRCAHDDGVNETMACDAVCRKCGKNLGFIGSRRGDHLKGGSL